MTVTRDTLQECTNPIDPDDLQKEYVNDVYEKVSHNAVNVDKFLEKGYKQMSDFDKTWS